MLFAAHCYCLFVYAALISVLSVAVESIAGKAQLKEHGSGGWVVPLGSVAKPKRIQKLRIWAQRRIHQNSTCVGKVPGFAVRSRMLVNSLRYCTRVEGSEASCRGNGMHESPYSPYAEQGSSSDSRQLFPKMQRRLRLILFRCPTKIQIARAERSHAAKPLSIFGIGLLNGWLDVTVFHRHFAASHYKSAFDFFSAPSSSSPQH